MDRPWDLMDKREKFNEGDGKYDNESRGGPIWTGPGNYVRSKRGKLKGEMKRRETRGGPIWTGPGI